MAQFVNGKRSPNKIKIPFNLLAHTLNNFNHCKQDFILNIETLTNLQIFQTMEKRKDKLKHLTVQLNKTTFAMGQE